MYFHSSFESLAEQNQNFRKEVFTGSSAQIVLMSLNPNEDIGEETHTNVDQILFFIEGSGWPFLTDQKSQSKKKMFYTSSAAPNTTSSTPARKG